MNEAQFIPFHTTDLTGKRVLVLAPHPDDETIGCGGTLALHAAAGDPIRVLILTNGAKGDVTGRFDRNAYIAIRQQETRAACAILGISDVTFWPYEDRELANAGTAVSDLVALIKDCQPELIYAPSPLEFHPDHRSAAVFIQAAVQLCRTEANLFFYEVGQPLQVDILVDITRVLDQKIQALHQYRSQLEERPYDELALALNRFRSLTLSKEVTHAEGFTRYRSSGLKTSFGDWTELSDKPVAAPLTGADVICAAGNHGAPGQAEEDIVTPSEITEENSPGLEPASEPAVIRHRSWGEKVGSAVKHWFGVT